MNCPNCGKEMVAGAKFCANCGAAVSSAAQAAGQAGPRVSRRGRTSGLAIASLVLGILGFFSWGLAGIAGIITGVMALGRIKDSQGREKGRGLALAGIITGAASTVLAFIAVIAIIAAIAIPGFLSARGKARQAEVKVNLQNICTAQMQAYVEKAQYATTFAELQFTPPENSSYAYFLSADQALQPAGKNYALPPDVQAFVSADTFQVVAVGNIDRDDDLDIWTIDQNQNLSNLADDLKN